MKRTILFSLLALVVVMIAGQACKNHSSVEPSFAAIEQGFCTLPDSMQLGVYWYWMSDNISKEGAIRDLEAMKAVGINQAFIGNIGIDDIPYGEVKLLTPEWWESATCRIEEDHRIGDRDWNI